ncbi:MAG: substrate-binding domain-containing protein, partial [bacterium]|nr:substrate-binding domain-containing protein [bacterium]
KKHFTIEAAFLDVFSLSTPYLSEVFKGLTATAAELGLTLQTSAIKSEQDFLSGRTKAVAQPEGLIIASRVSLNTIAYLKEREIPFVWLDNDIPFQDIACVLDDRVYGMLLAVDHLIAGGRRRISLIDLWGDCEMLAAFRTVFAAKGVDMPDDRIIAGRVMTSAEEVEPAYRAAQKLFAAPVKPDSIIVTGEASTQMVIKAAMEAGLSIPEDVTVVSFSSIAGGDFFSVPVDIVRMPVSEMAGQAVRLLYRMLSGEAIEERKIMIKPHLMRAS